MSNFVVSDVFTHFFEIYAAQNVVFFYLLYDKPTKYTQQVFNNKFCFVVNQVPEVVPYSPKEASQ